MKTESFLFESAAPWAGAVNIGELLNDIEAVIKLHVVLNDQAAAALAVWVLHSYTFERRDTVAYVAIESPEKRCGKTTLISVLAAMAHKPLIASNISVGALFRAIDTCRPTLFIDEADTFLAGNNAMRGIINSGNTWRTAYVLRLTKARHKVPAPAPAPGSAPDGAENGLKRFSCWCPKVIALIGAVPDTISDRSIVVKMNRKLTSEICAPLAELDTAEIRSKCARFALDAGPSIAAHPKIRGEGLNDRAADTFDPLFVITRLAGPEWEQKLHTAAVSLASSANSESAGVQLLLDILSIFIECGRDKVFSRVLANTLREGEGCLKSMAVNAATLNEQQLAHLLRPYGIKPVSIRLGKQVNRGYAREDFVEAVKRYVPPDDAEARAKELQRRSDLRTEAKAEAAKEAAIAEAPTAGK